MCTQVGCKANTFTICRSPIPIPYICLGRPHGDRRRRLYFNSGPRRFDHNYSDLDWYDHADNDSGLWRGHVIKSHRNFPFPARRVDRRDCDLEGGLQFVDSLLPILRHCGALSAQPRQHPSITPVGQAWFTLV